VRAAYDLVAADYDAQFGAELRRKVIDRALLTALLDYAGPGVVADVGCGSGQITRFLADRHEPVVGFDLSPAMVDRARANAPTAALSVASMTDLPVADGAWAGIVSSYSVVNLAAGQRRAAYAEFARVLQPGGWLFLSFHIESTDGSGGTMGGEQRLTQWFEHEVDLTFYYLDPAEESAALEAAGFVMMSTTVRRPLAEVENQTRRGYLLAQRP
jgi:ubiquinone/menaquinone biosynthesis C-methylase UbiE